MSDRLKISMMLLPLSIDCRGSKNHSITGMGISRFMIQLLLLFLLTLQLLIGCASLPEYAKPRVGKSIEIEDSSKFIQYRQLQKRDFQAPSVSGEYQKHAMQLQAYTRVVILPKKKSSFTINAADSFNQTVYHVGIESLAFGALMDPASSWWSHKIPKRKISYVLQHEQIHFALMEIAARQMTWEVKKDSSQFSSFGSSRQEALELLKNSISKYIRENLEKAMIVHTEFDEETSLYHDPRAQQQWYEKVNRQLDALPASHQ